MYSSFKERLEATTGTNVFKLSHSSRDLFRSCKRKFEFRKLYPQPSRTDNWDAMVGKALHAAYQNYLIFRDEDRAIWTLISNFDLTVQSKKQYEPKTLEASFATLLAIINHNSGLLECQVAKVMVNGEERPAIEVPFQINLMMGGRPYEIAPGVPVAYIGFIDDILVNYITYEYIVEDLKTHRREMDDMTAVYAYNDQPLPYAMIISAALGQEVNSLRMKYLSAYIDIRKPKVRPYEFLKDASLVQDWARGLYLDLEDIKRFIAIDWWPRNGNACIAFNSICPHFDICGSRDSNFIADYFDLAKDPKYEGQDFKPWFTLDLELAA